MEIQWEGDSLKAVGRFTVDSENQAGLSRLLRTGEFEALSGAGHVARLLTERASSRETTERTGLCQRDRGATHLEVFHLHSLLTPEARGNAPIAIVFRGCDFQEASNEAFGRHWRSLAIDLKVHGVIPTRGGE